ncbi:MAG TPA: hypothetical protein VEK08_15100 [Planctomycetota bacterium]|nr:hypothetical protein [Planctomycetota bacterium]
MSENTLSPEQHRRVAVDLFNHVWTLIEKKNRTPEECDNMIHAAHASRHHWGVVGTPINLARGEWQVARVYAVLNRPEPALFHGRRCLEVCEENGIGDFDIAYAHEAIARAHAAAGRFDESRRHTELARLTGEKIKEKDDRDLLLSDLATIPQQR